MYEVIPPTVLSYDPSCPFQSIRLARVFTEGVVIQRDKTLRVWGWAHSLCEVSAHLILNIDSPERREFWSSVVQEEGSGFWVAHFPPIKSTTKNTVFSLIVQSNGGETFTVERVYLGDVYLCSGQSNVQWPSFDKTLEVLSDSDRLDIKSIQNSSVISMFVVPKRESSSENSDFETGDWFQPGGPLDADGSFIWVGPLCWYMAHNLSKALGDNIPIGVIQSSAPGTFIQAWSSPESTTVCTAPDTRGEGILGVPNEPSSLFWGMIEPFWRGPIALAGVVWVQGEANSVNCQHSYYKCALLKLVQDWRGPGLQNDDTPFVIADVQPALLDTSPQFAENASPCFGEVRRIQLEQDNPSKNVHVVSSGDLGDPTGDLWHSRYKKTLGDRIAAAFLGHTPGHMYIPAFQGPRYNRGKVTDTAGKAAHAGDTLSVTIKFSGAENGLELREPTFHSICGARTIPGMEELESNCAWFGLMDNYGVWHNASASVVGYQGREIKLTVHYPSNSPRPARPKSTKYGYGAWPSLILYGKDRDIPAFPWVPTDVED